MYLFSRWSFCKFAILDNCLAMQMKKLCFWAVAILMLLSSCQNSKPSFVRVEDGKFVSDDNYPSYFAGTNFWYGAILGSEGQGVREEILTYAQNQLIIPMNPNCESLNAAIAAAIVMWQMKL